MHACTTPPWIIIEADGAVMASSTKAGVRGKIT